jgi:hypothetical protein
MCTVLNDFRRTAELPADVNTHVETRLRSLTAVARVGQVPQTVPAAKQVKGQTGRITDESKALLGFISEDFVLLVTAGQPCAYRVESGHKISKDGFELYCAQHYGAVVMESGDGACESVPSGPLWWKWNHPSRRVVHELVMEPTHLPEHDDPAMRGGQVYNLWHTLKKTMVTPNMDASEADVRIYIDHLRYLADGDEQTVQFVLCWLATLYQRPGIKIPSALFFVSEAQGTGKSLATSIMRPIFGAPLYGCMDGSQLRKNFTDAIEHKRICEVEELSSADTREAMEKLKSWISANNFKFEGKGKAARDGKNFAHFVFTANNLDGLHISKEDRRFAVIRCTSEPKPRSYYVALGAWVGEQGPGPALLAGYLAKFEFPAGWDPDDAPPRSEAKQAVQEASRSPQADAIAGRIADRLPPFDRDLGFLGDRRDPDTKIEARGVVQRLNDLGLSCSFNAKNLSTALQQCGAAPLKKGKAAEKTAWCWRREVQPYWDGRSLHEWTANMYRGEVPDNYAAWVAAHGSKDDE